MITVDAKAAGKGKVTCTVSTPDGAELDVDVVENHDGTFDIYYTAPEPGKYVITIRFGGEHIPNSPFHVLVSSAATAELGVAGRLLVSVMLFSSGFPLALLPHSVSAVYTSSLVYKH